MAKQRQSLSGKVVAITGGARGIGKATATALVRKGCRVAIGDLDLELAEADGGGARRRHGRAAARRHRPRLLRRLPRRRRARARPARRGRQQRRDHAGDAVRRGVRRLDQAPARHQRLRRHRRHAAGDRAAAARAASGHIVNLASQAGKGGFPGIATYSGTKHAVVGISEAVRAELRGSGVEIACVMPTVGQHRADRRGRPAADQTGRGRGRRQRDRRRARSAALRRLGAARQRRPLQGRRQPAARHARGRSAA